MMDLKKLFSTKRIVFILLFTIMVLVGKKVNFSPVIGVENQFFTLFQFFGPIAGAFLGPVFGVISVLGAEVLDILIMHKEVTLISAIRLTPMLFAAYYFGASRKKLSALIPLACMALFILHPVGRQAWFYSLYWLIPITAAILIKIAPGKLFLRSLGATFTAHAIGSVAFLYTVPMTASEWIGLIPVVAYERLMFASGIAVSFLAMNYALDWILDKLKQKFTVPEEVLHIDRNYLRA